MKIKGIPRGLARVRKELPPPGRIFKSKKKDSRKQSKAALWRELEILSRASLRKNLHDLI